MDCHDEEGDVAIGCGREPPVRSQVALGGAESKIGADFKVASQIKSKYSVAVVPSLAEWVTDRFHNSGGGLLARGFLDSCGRYALNLWSERP